MRVLCFVLAFAAMLYICPAKPCDASYADDFSEEMSGLSEIVPEDAHGGLSQFGIDISEPSSVTDINPADVLSSLIAALTERLGAPLRLFVAICALAAISSIISRSPAAPLITAVAGAYIISAPVSVCLNLSAAVLSTGSAFMQGFIPIYAGITALGGKLTASASYNVLTLLAAQGGTFTADTVILPLTGICAAISIVDALNPTVRLGSMLAFIKKAAVWILGGIMTIFIGMLALQTAVGSAADTLAARGGKFLASSLIPVVGSAVSEAYSTLGASMQLLRSGTGVFGIVVMLSCLLPAIVSCALYMLSLSLAGAAAELFGSPALGRLCANMSSVLELALAVMASFTVLMVICTAIMIKC